jgi:hypothetical protein
MLIKVCGTHCPAINELPVHDWFGRFVGDRGRARVAVFERSHFRCGPTCEVLEKILVVILIQPDLPAAWKFDRDMGVVIAKREGSAFETGELLQANLPCMMLPDEDLVASLEAVNVDAIYIGQWDDGTVGITQAGLCCFEQNRLSR